MSKSVIGGKASYLKKLQKEGYKIPPFFVWDGELASPEAILKRAKKELPSVDYFAVRSSAKSEDSKEKSFAGHFYSAIAVPRGNLYQEARNVVDAYKGMEGSVIIQEFIPSDKAGVIFSDAGHGQIVINSNFGLCETVVKGMVCDEYIFDSKGLLVSKHIANNKEAHFLKGEKIEIIKPLSQESLTESEIRQLIEIAKNLETFLKGPQDIEWCFYEGVLYILQSRPITRKIFNKEVSHFDSANIAESYSGVVLPLTCSFAAFIYKTVYEDLLVHSGVSRDKVNRHPEIFSNMLAFFYGRMYYNMNNWYKMAAFIPGYKRNKRNLELMITSNIKEDIEQDISPTLGLKFKYPFLVVFKLLFLPLTIKRFKKRTSEKIKEAYHMPIHSYSFEKCRETYLNLNQKLLKNWYITVENDFMVMTYFGILKKVYGDEILRDLISFKSASSKQIAAIGHLASTIKSVPTLYSHLQKKNESEFYKELKFYSDVKKELDAYYEKYGGRFANELKLESTDLQEDFKKFAQIINLYSNPISHPANASSCSLPGGMLKKNLMGLVLKKFKKYSSQREELRLLRSNSFAIVRKLFSRVGEVFVDKGIINKKDDIFYLQIDEIFGNSDSSKIQNLNAFVKNRRKEYDSFKEVTPLSHFSIKLGEEAPISQTRQNNNKTLQGRACTSGLIRGKVKVFREFSIPDKIDFDILVARHTDPGWTSLIGLSKGLIIEHGGILSHASIVSRELGIPTVIGAEGVLDMLKDGQLVELNGSTGLITVL